MKMEPVAAGHSLRLGRITVPVAWRSYLVYAAWAQALAATAGSLYFSEVRDFWPCMLCWYQRILMYPLIVIIAVGIVRRDRGLYWTVLPLSLAGAGVAIYHNLLQQGVVSEGIVSCQFGVSCQVTWIEWLGFITIPMMSLTAFSIITILMTIYAASTAIKITAKGDEE